MSAQHLTSIRLVAGASDQAGWTLTETDGRALFRVGSAEECNWRVIADGVAAHQLMLMWNGRELTVIDVGGGEVRIDGRVLEGTAIVRSGRIEFGDAALEVKSAGGAGVVWSGLGEASTSLDGRTFGPGAPDSSAPAAMSDVVTIATPAQRRGGSHPRIVAAGATEIMDAPPVPVEDSAPRPAPRRASAAPPARKAGASAAPPAAVENPAAPARKPTGATAATRALRPGGNGPSQAARRSGATMTLPSGETTETSPGPAWAPPGAYASTEPLGSRSADGKGVQVPSLTIGRRRPPAPLDQTRVPAGTPPSMPAQERGAAASSPAPVGPAAPPRSQVASGVVSSAPRVPPAAPPSPPAPSALPAGPQGSTAAPHAPPTPTAAPPLRTAAPHAPPSTPTAAPPLRTAAPPAPTVCGKPAAGKASRATAAPAPVQATRMPEPVRAPELPPPMPEPSRRRLPPRTWALLAVTVAVGVGLLIVGGGSSSAVSASAGEPPSAAEQAAQPAGDAAAAVELAAPAQPADHAAAAVELATPAQPEASPDAPAAPLAAATQAAADPAVALDLVDPADPLATAHCKQERSRRRRRCQPHTRERVAADLVLEGRRAEAAARYRRLHADTGDQRFAILADILTSAACDGAAECP